ncbi:hypothetical protein GA0115240_17381, partial [Streptomyces sp. DvalAA-14]
MVTTTPADDEPDRGGGATGTGGPQGGG